MNNNLIVFIKNPALGTVKTRLAKSIGDNKALEVYLSLLDKCREETVKIEANRFLFYSDKIMEDSWSASLFNKQLQHPGDLGDRIKAAFDYVNEIAKGKTIIIGSDCYDLSAERIAIAFDQLDQADVVIGPANDGGYYLLGANSYHPFLFDEISWSTSAVLNQTLNQAKKHNLTTKILEELVDIDTLEDLQLSSFPYNEKTNDRKYK